MGDQPHDPDLYGFRVAQDASATLTFVWLCEVHRLDGSVAEVSMSVADILAANLFAYSHDWESRMRLVDRIVATAYANLDMLDRRRAG